MNRRILKLEKYLILGPVTIILVPGLLYLLLMPLGDASWVFSSGSAQKQISFILFEVLTLLSAGALYAIWVAVENYLESNITISFSTNPYVYSAIVIGVIISLSSLFELVYPNHLLKQALSIRENTAFLMMYIFGLHICIPAIHMLIVGRLNCANK